MIAEKESFRTRFFMKKQRDCSFSIHVLSSKHIKGGYAMQQFGMSMLWFWVCYAIVTCVGILHTVFNIYVLKMKPMDEHSMGEGYEKTKPWHPLYNIILFTLFGWLYMNGLPQPTLAEALITGGIWAGICIAFDVVCWVLIKHPWSLSFKEFYVDYQPWITLIYIAIFLGPVVGFYLC